MFEESSVVGTPMRVIKAYLPVMESFGMISLNYEAKTLSQCICNMILNMKRKFLYTQVAQYRSNICVIYIRCVYNVTRPW